MTSQIGNGESISVDEPALELARLQEAARLASIFHSEERKFKKRTDLTHVVHASLHFTELTILLAIEIFHHAHHYSNRYWREKDEDIPMLPEERNPIFFIYPICMVMSLILGIFWLTAKQTMLNQPKISLVVSAVAAVLMLITGIMEMKHADTYIDITEFTDEEILAHPVFIHNFVMCILSIFVMTIYLVQAWVLFDRWMWVRQQGHDTSSVSGKTQSSISDVSQSSTIGEKISKHDEFEEHLAPIPTLKDLSVPEIVVDDIEQEIIGEPIIYCCFVDWYNYCKLEANGKLRHEFQVIHVM